MSETDEDGDAVLEPTPLVPEIHEVLSDPGKFVANMTETVVYTLFVPLSPVEAMRKWEKESIAVRPLTLCGVEGCLVSTESQDFYDALCSEFACGHFS